MSITRMIALFTSRGTFIHNFNHFAAPYTHQTNTYAATIATAAKSGVMVNPPFSIGNTVPLLGVLAIATIYPFISAAYSGELRQARSTRTAQRIADDRRCRPQHGAQSIAGQGSRPMHYRALHHDRSDFDLTRGRLQHV